MLGSANISQTDYRNRLLHKIANTLQFDKLHEHIHNIFMNLPETKEKGKVGNFFTTF